MAVQAAAPKYHTAHQHVIQAKKAIEKNYDILSAIQSLKQVYIVAEEIFRANAFGERYERGIPYSVAHELMELMISDKLQFEDEFKYHAARACRIFVDLTFYECVTLKRNLFPDTHKKLLDNILKVRETLPKRAINTAYELKCCWATSLVLNDEMMYLKQFAMNNLPDIISAIATQSPGGLIKPLLNVGKDVYRLWKTSWFKSVYALHMWGKCLVVSPKLNAADATYDPSNSLKEYFHTVAKHIPEYRKTKSVATCIANTLFEVVEKALASGKQNTEDFLIKMLNGENEKTNPGIKHFVNVGLDKKLNHWWKLRYQVINKLFDLLLDKRVPQKVWKAILDILIDKQKMNDKEKKENQEIDKLFERRLEELKEKEVKADFEFLKERAQYLRDNRKVDKKELDGKGKQIEDDLKINLAKFEKKKQQASKEEESSDEDKDFSSEESLLSLQLSLENLQSELEYINKLKTLENF